MGKGVKALLYFSVGVFIVGKGLSKSALEFEESFSLTQSTESASSSSLKFITMGDWGTFTAVSRRKLSEEDEQISFLANNNGNNNNNNNKQYWSILVAEAMAAYASSNPADFLLALGDNFYSNGVSSVDDSLWTTLYANVYNYGSLQIPWYAVFGNHDYGSKNGQGSLQAQIDFGEQGYDNRWHAGYCYKQSFSVPYSTTTVDIVFIDTTLIAPEETYVTSTSAGVSQETQQEKVQEQLSCLEGYLSGSTASYLLVAGHYPIFSTGKNSPGDMTTLVEILYPILEKYNVDVYLCGHDHFLEHLQFTNGSSTMDFVISGAAGKPDNALTSGVTSAADMKFAVATGGFVFTTVTPGEMIMDFVDYSGAVIYTTTRAQTREQAYETSALYGGMGTSSKSWHVQRFFENGLRYIQQTQHEIQSMSALASFGVVFALASIILLVAQVYRGARTPVDNHKVSEVELVQPSQSFNVKEPDHEAPALNTVPSVRIMDASIPVVQKVSSLFTAPTVTPPPRLGQKPLYSHDVCKNSASSDCAVSPLHVPEVDVQHAARDSIVKTCHENSVETPNIVTLVNTSPSGNNDRINPIRRAAVPGVDYIGQVDYIGRSKIDKVDAVRAHAIKILSATDPNAVKTKSLLQAFKRSSVEDVNMSTVSASANEVNEILSSAKGNGRLPHRNLHKVNYYNPVNKDVANIMGKEKVSDYL